MTKARKTANDLLVEAVARIEASTARISSDVSGLNATTVRQQGTLEEHMRRTEANEKHLDLIENRIKPIEAHVSMWAGAGKVLAVVGTLAGICVAIYKILETLR